MAPPRPKGVPKLWATDEELAKKDDDIRLPGHVRHHGQWQHARPPRRSFIARLLGYCAFLFLIGFLIYQGVRSFGSGTLQSQSSMERHLNPRPPPDSSPPQEEVDRDKMSSDSSQGRDEKSQYSESDGVRTYKGPLKLPALAATLRVLSRTGGATLKNTNVLFAAASLTSAGALLPMACQMSDEDLNTVHFALMGSSDVTIKDLLSLNGITRDCKVTMHDARVDHGAESSVGRLSLAAARAIFHINNYMHPQAIIVDSTNAEETYFLSAVEEQVRYTAASLIELPDHSRSRLGWINKLEASALAVWDQIQLDILIHVPPGASGNLRRLLRSLSHADMSPLTPPHITIELPPDVDDTTTAFLAEFQWPPGNAGLGGNLLSLRHRIQKKKLTEEESSVRFLESFWPSNPARSHVLVLSANTEVAPNFFNYLTYTLLAYRYSARSITLDWDKGLLGFSLANPTQHLDGSTTFTSPRSNSDEGTSDSPFLWQAPSSDAMLFMGDKWVELHGYISRLFEKQSSWSAKPDLISRKEVSKKHPAWLELVLQLCRIRGYYTIYPGQHIDSAVLGIHSDLNDDPEEYRGEAANSEGGKADRASSMFDPSSSVDMLAALPKDGTLPSWATMPILSWNGQRTSWEDLKQESLGFTREFRRQVGGCGSDKKAPKRSPNARDLFCS